MNRLLRVIRILLPLLMVSGRVYVAHAQETWTVLPTIPTSSDTSTVPQSKAWFHGHTWWAVLPASSPSNGQWVFRLEPDNTWTPVLKVSGLKGRADAKAHGDLTHVLIVSSDAQVVTIQYDPALRTYRLWPDNPVPTPVFVGETGTLEVDSTGRLWLATDHFNFVQMYYSDYPYSSFAGPIYLTTETGLGDVNSIVAFPNHTIGVLWSNGNLQRWGFRVHIDGTDPNEWLADEAPLAAEYGGLDMADDHINLALAANGTLYAAVKSKHSSSIMPPLYLLVRHPKPGGPGGTWDNAPHPIQDVTATTETGSGRRPSVLLNEDTNTLRVFYHDSAATVFFKESDARSISFGPRRTLMSGEYVTSTKDSWAGRLVVLATMSGTAGVLMTTTPDLVGYWKMDEGSGAQARDMSGWGNDARLVGHPSWTTGAKGLAINLDGAGTYGLVSDQERLDATSAITLSAWIKPRAQSSQDIISREINGSVDGYALSLSPSNAPTSPGTVFMQLNEATFGNVFRVYSRTRYPFDGTTWMHVAASYDGTTMRMYVNGVEEQSIVGPVSIAANPLDVGLGAQSDGTRRFQGQLDEVRIYRRALSEAEIVALATIPHADLVVTKSNFVSTVEAAKPTTYSIQASNLGPAGALATVSDDLPARLTGATWTCTAAGGASCTASGSGSLNDLVSLPAGGSVAYTLQAMVASGPSGTLVNTATVMAADAMDPVTDNNSATDTDNIIGTTPPQITTQPASVIVTVPAAAGFAVAATGTTPLSYQWRRNGVTIAGATGNSYVLNSTALADNGAQFSVVITNVAGTVTSSAATLTVLSGAEFRANFDAGSDDFIYADDVFRATTKPAYASGLWLGSGGFTGGALRVVLGGIDGSNISKISGGWQRGFALAGATPATLTFRYQLTSANLDADEFSQVLVGIDGALRGVPPADYVVQVVGTGATVTSGWQLVQLDLGTLPAGPHVLTLGGYINKKGASNETAEVLLDDVSLTTALSAVPPSITTPPVSVTVTAPAAASFAVVAAGSTPLGYQWRRNGVTIAGATGTSYVLNPTAGADSGAQFDVVVTNTAGSVTSVAATLTVNAAAVPPSITTPPAAITVTAPGAATFAVSASGTAPLAYQWRRNGVTIAGATGTSYILDPTAVADSGAQFDVVVSNGAGTVTSPVATLTVLGGGGGGGGAAFEAHFDTDADGFSYADDLFRATAKPAYASGLWLGSGGFAGGGLRVLLGGVDGANISKMSGGWQRSVTLATAGPATLSFRYRLSAANLKSDRFGQMLVSLNGVLYGVPPNDYIARVVGGLGGVSSTTDWQQVQLDLGVLPAGTHALALGGYLSGKSGSSETVEVLIDDVAITY